MRVLARLESNKHGHNVNTGFACDNVRDLCDVCLQPPKHTVNHNIVGNPCSHFVLTPVRVSTATTSTTTEQQRTNYRCNTSCASLSLPLWMFHILQLGIFKSCVKCNMTSSMGSAGMLPPPTSTTTIIRTTRTITRTTITMQSSL
jgi:hypothetical protein